jgi:ABC-type multidrug transport system ATPase subunit
MVRQVDDDQYPSSLVAASAGRRSRRLRRRATTAGGKRILGVVPQQSVVVEELSALANCTFFGALYGVEKSVLRERARALLDWIELSDHLNKPAGALSGGMLRRLTLVLGIVHEPKALILDEPTTGLDPQTRLLILDRIREIAAKGTAVLLTPIIWKKPNASATASASSRRPRIKENAAALRRTGRRAALQPAQRFCAR